MIDTDIRPADDPFKGETALLILVLNLPTIITNLLYDMIVVNGLRLSQVSRFQTNVKLMFEKIFPVVDELVSRLQSDWFT